MRPVKTEFNVPPAEADANAASPAHQSAIAQTRRLFESYAPALRAFLLRRLGNIEDAREAAQEVFLHLWRQERKGLLEGDARAYLFAAAHNWVKDCRRRARSRVLDRHESLEEQELAAVQPNGDDVVHWRAGLEAVLESVRELPVETQRIFHLYHGSRMTYPQIAKELGVTPRTVERHMAQAIAHCKRRLKAYLED